VKKKQKARPLGKGPPAKTPKQATAEKAHQQLAKINRPILAHVYARLRLFSWLDKARRKHPIIWVQAPPGAGKTTLIASYLKVSRLT
jgi:ATP/maltotriose-dependent transcriptional regulator MalT